MDTIIKNLAVNIMYLTFGMAALLFAAGITEKTFKFSFKTWMDYIEDGAKKGNTLPAAAVIVAVVYLWSRILPAFIQ